MTNIAVFASGSGTNAENIIRYFARSPLARVALVVTDNPAAGVIERAERHGVKVTYIPRAELCATTGIVELLQHEGIGYIVLAGFLALLPPAVVDGWRGRIVNIHPALLPAYGGKGMYGDRVHRAVIDAGERESGITIHAVNERYDEGDIVAQFRTPVHASDTPGTLAARIHELEYEHFPKIIEQEVRKLKVISDK